MTVPSPAIRVEARDSCPVCGSAGRLLYSGLEDRLFDTAGKWSMSQCGDEKCGLLWLNPRPLEEDINRAYEKYYSHTARRQPRLSLATIPSSAFRYMTLATLYAGGLLRERADVASMHLDELAPGRLLDVGCGDGVFLQRMKQRGWMAEGTDFDETAARAAMNRYSIEVKIGRLGDIAYPPNSFDVVTLNHVVEHLHDPVSVFREIGRILKPAGTVIAVTPNANSWGHSHYGPHWRGLEPPRHIHVFTLAALRAVTVSAGLIPSRIYSTAANAHFVLADSMKIAAAEAGVQMSPRPTVSMLVRALGMTLFEARRNAQTGSAGEEIVLVAQKSS